MTTDTVQETSTEVPSRNSLSLPPVLRLFCLTLCSFAAISAVASDIFYHIGRFNACCTLAYDDPYFVDFWHYSYIFRFFHTAAFFHNADHFAYPAFAAVIFDLLYHLGPHAQAIFLSFELIVCTSAAYLLFRRIRSRGVRTFPAAVLSSTTLLFSCPLFYSFLAGNIEILLCFLTAAGLWAMWKGYEIPAAILWGAAGAVKIYPLILLALFFSRAKWRLLVLGVVACGVISALSMWFIGPTIAMAFAGTVNGIGGFVSTYAQTVRTQELPYDHSFLAPIKILLYVKAHRTGTLSYLTKPYLLLAGTLAGSAFLLRVRHMPLPNRVLFLFTAMVALPPVSYEYTLVNLYAPWAMLVLLAIPARGAEFDRSLRVFFLCFAVLFTSESFIYYHWIHASGPLKAIALLVLGVAAMVKVLPNDIHRNRESSPGVEFREQIVHIDG